MNRDIISAVRPAARKRRSPSLSTTALIVGLAVAGQAYAQTSLDSASVALPAASNALLANLTVEKMADETGFVITIANNGTEAISGALVSDKVGNGLLCPAENALVITGSGSPAGSYTLADLIASGITLNTLRGGQKVAISYSCQAS